MSKRPIIVGIYKITNPSGHVYIGQSRDTRKRFMSYRGGKVILRQPGIGNSILKHGFEAHEFEVIHELPLDVSDLVLDKYEILYWELYKACGIRMLNAKYPGSRGILTEEARRRIGQKNSINLQGTKYTSERLERLKLRLERDKPRERYKKVIGQYTLEGTFVRSWTGIGVAAAELGISMGNISSCVSSRYGRRSAGGFIWRSSGSTQIAPISKNIGRTKRRDKIIQTSKEGNIIREWESASLASRTLSINRASISLCIANRQYSAGGFVWRERSLD